MTETPGRGYARRRRRASSRQGPPPQPTPTPPPSEPVAAAAPVAPQASAPSEKPAPKHRRPRRSSRDSSEGGLHDLVGGGHSQLGVSGALRGRDLNRPTDDDLAEAERTVEIVRRHWKPAP